MSDQKPVIGKITTRRQFDTLNELRAANANLEAIGHRGGFAKPMDCGGSDGSHHGSTLRALAQKGLCDVRTYTPSFRKVYTYKINAAGRAALLEWMR